MPSNCAFYGCPVIKSKRWPYISLFGLPNEKKHPEWRENVIGILCRTRDPKSLNVNTATICSRHYTEDDIQTGRFGRRVLKVGSLPTENLPQHSMEIAAINSRVSPTHPAMPKKVFYFDLMDLQNETGEHILLKWRKHYSDDDNFILRKQFDEGWTLYVTVKKHLYYTIRLDGHKVELRDVNIENICNFKINNLLEKIDEYNVCRGLSSDMSIMPAGCFIHTTTVTSELDDCGSQILTCVRSNECMGLIVGETACKECRKFQSQKFVPFRKKRANLSETSREELIVSLESCRDELEKCQSELTNLLQGIENNSVSSESNVDDGTFEGVETKGGEFADLFHEEQKERNVDGTKVICGAQYSIMHKRNVTGKVKRKRKRQRK